MVRKPNVLCAGACGGLMFHGRGSLPVGQAMCRDCRAARRRGIVCVICGSTFEFTRPTRGPAPKTCSNACAQKARLSYGHPCLDCGTTVVGYHSRRCDPCRIERRREHYRRKNVIRRGAAVVGPVMTVADLGERDGWRCHLCRRRVNPALVSPHPMSATKDHLIPIARGGVDDPANLALAHRRCNTKRGTRGTVQLALIG